MICGLIVSETKSNFSFRPLGIVDVGSRTQLLFQVSTNVSDSFWPIINMINGLKRCWSVLLCAIFLNGHF